MALAKHRHHKPAGHGAAHDLCPRNALHEHGLGQQTAYELITNELLLDGSARLNLATFVTTWMPSLAADLMAQTPTRT